MNVSIMADDLGYTQRCGQVDASIHGVSHFPPGGLVSSKGGWTSYLQYQRYLFQSAGWCPQGPSKPGLKCEYQEETETVLDKLDDSERGRIEL